ncbi:CAP domain-containing protein [Paracoccus marinaquae]|uniref:CAP domain-containing protein n=1 Tax=Paracoccus marinaquae TaxID=2841926 RepID=A0ABS6ALS0_9RHOB|nr:CAP domain-containing protein [Paracoccus marinaquae]MBU3031533.1 CAP domain-containing protein [Paracoccus marinaquae]
MTSLTSLLTLVLCGAVLAGCGTATGTSRGKPDPHAVQAAAPGKAACVRTTPAENAEGAQATNAARGQAGLPPVRANMLLAEVAASHACDMATRGLMTHRGSSSTGPGPRVKARGYATRLTAENIAAGPYDLPRVLGEWNRSQGHLDNIMIPQVRDYGIGQAVGADGRTRFWTAIYAAPR